MCSLAFPHSWPLTTMMPFMLAKSNGFIWFAECAFDILHHVWNSVDILAMVTTANHCVPTAIFQ